MLKTCPVCATVFNARNSKQRCCSHSCDVKTRPARGKLTVPCATCGKDFDRWPYDVTRKACSRACARVGRSAPRPDRRVRPQRACATCAVLFWPDSDSRKFCSLPCYATSMTVVNGAEHRNWKGGSWGRPDLSRSGWARLRKRLLAEAGHRCSNCGLQSERMAIHHIKGHRDAPDLLMDESNLRVLCPACHTRLHNPVLARWEKRRQPDSH